MSAEFYDDLTVRALAEEANGGVCSIAVNNILLTLPRLTVTDQISEYFDPYTSSFRTPILKEPIPDSFLSFWRQSPDSPQQDNGFRKIAEDINLECGLKVDVGFNEKQLGMLTQEGLFLPFIQFCDQRSESDCSYAIFLSLPAGYIDQLVVTKDDETKVVVGERDQRGVVVAKEVLDQVSLLQQESLPHRIVERDTKEATKNLKTYLNLNAILTNALNFDPDSNYEAEEKLRLVLKGRLDQANKTGSKCITLCGQSIHAGEGLSTEGTLTTKLLAEDDGSIEIVESIEFPNAMRKRPAEVLKLSIGQRIGSAVLVSCVETDKKLEEAITHINSEIGRLNTASMNTETADLTRQSELFAKLYRPEDIQKVENIQKRLTDYFKSKFFFYKPEFNPLIVDYGNGLRKLVVTDTSEKGLDLVNRTRRGYKKEDDFVVDISNRFFDTRRGLTKAVVQTLIQVVPTMNELVWITDAESGRIEEYADCKDGSVTFKRIPNLLFNPPGFRFRPVIVTDIPLEP